MPQERELEGQVSLVTGASRGIGLAIARRLARAGTTVVCIARGADRLKAAVASLLEEKLCAEALPLDVTDETAVRTAVDGILSRHARIDHLINNAGITRDALLLRMKTDDWKAVLETNLTGLFLMTRSVLPFMIRSRSGRIVNLSSVVAHSGNPGQSNYCASKAAIEGFTRSLALEIASRGITVNAVAPGFIETDMTSTLGAKVREEMAERIPMGRLGQPEDVAAVVRFLVGKAAGYITGATLDVNGGMYL